MGKKLTPMLFAVLAFGVVGGMSCKADAEQRKVIARKANLEKRVKREGNSGSPTMKQQLTGGNYIPFPQRKPKKKIIFC